MAIDFQPDFDFQPEDSVKKGPNNWTEQYNKYLADVKKRRSRTPIPGSEEYDSTPAMSYKDYVADQEKRAKEKYIGAGEAALSFATGLGATIAGAAGGIVAPINPLARSKNPLKEFETIQQDLTYSPKTIEGQRFAEMVGHPLQAFPPVGAYVTGPVVRGAKKPVPTKPDAVLDTLRKNKEQEVPAVTPQVTPQIDFRLESPIAADNRVAEMNRNAVRGADDWNSMDHAARAVNEEIAAKEAYDAHQAAMAEQAAEQARLSELDNWRNNAKQDSIVEDFGNNDPLARMPEMRIDENGIPIRADLSMEAANLENPLQRNLWGDELPIRTGDNGIPLTQALDSMPPGPAREIAIANLRGHQEVGRIKGIENSVGIPDNIARFEGEGGGLGRGQRGAIDVSIFDPSYDKYKKLNDNLVLRFRGGPEPTVYAVDTTNKASPKVISHAKFGRDTHWRPTDPSQNLQPNWVHTIPERQKQGIASEMYKFVSELGNDIVPDSVQTDYGKKLWESMNRKGLAEGKVVSGLKRTQSGAFDFKGIAEEAKKLTEALAKVGSKAVNVLTPKERAIPDVVRGHDYIPKGDSPDSLVAKALSEGKDGPALNQYTQSGLQLAGEKAGSALQQGIARWISWAEKTSNKYFRDIVKPIERDIGNLSKKDMNQLWGILKDEMFDRSQYGVDALRKAGASEKVVAAYEKLRQNFDETLNTLNKHREMIGKEPLTKQSAYLSSQWYGNYHVPLYDANGKLVWYIKTSSLREARNALKWIGENHPDIDVSKSKPTYKPSDISPRIPKDITDTVNDMIKLFGEDSPVAKELGALMEEAKATEAFNSRGFKVHFEQKSNIRGFLGDRPWLSPEENSLQGLKAQIAYLKEAHRWAPMQEAMANVKQVLGNEELLAQQPNNIAMAKAYTANALGVTTSITRDAENALARILRTSPGAMAQIVGDAKSITYLQLLSMSVGYMVATPLQAFILGPSHHMSLSSQGVKHNFLKTMVNSISDGTKIILNHEASNWRGKDTNVGLSALGKEAKKYMEENGVATIDLFDEYANLGEHKVVSGAKSVLGGTISFPEKVARSMTFMSFVHHLNDRGFKGTRNEMFRRAEELTDQTLTKFSRTARPLAVDAMGMAGELTYTFQSPIFNYYNNLGLFARQAQKTGNYLPLLSALLVMPAVLGGVQGIPGMNEADGLWNLAKSGLAKYAPAQYSKVKDFGIREWQLEHLPDFMTYGSVSALSDTQMQSRFSTQAIDVENPLGKVAPVPQAVGNWASIAGANGETGVNQAAWNNLPPMGKGILETFSDRFKAGEPRPDGRQPMLNPNRLSENQNSNYPRSKEDHVRRILGLSSLGESRAKETLYLNNQENRRMKTARDTAIDKLWDGVMTKNQAKVDENAQAFIDLDGSDTELKAAIERKLQDTYLTQQEKEAMKANTISKVMNLKRRLEMSR